MDIAWVGLIGLLSVAAVGGFLYGSRRMISTTQSGQGGLHPEYLKGLNYVLNERPDKAIEVFIKLLDVDNETIETHLALGNLFRRRGEVDRAIRIHQNLIARPNLTNHQRAFALLELGVDYMRSGLLDRAEGLFNELVNTGFYRESALTELLDIYQQEKDWEKSIQTARQLESCASRSLAPIIAQFYCEQVCVLRQQGAERCARDVLKKALNTDANCVRASLIDAELLHKAGKLKHAIRVYKNVEKQDSAYLSEVIAPMGACYRALGKIDEFENYLRTIVDRYGGITAVIALTELIAERDSEEAAMRFIAGALKKRPTVRGVDHLVDYVLVSAEGKIREDLTTVKELMDTLLEDQLIYQCNHCGFETRSLYWQCPSCKKWNTVKPIHGITGE